MVRCIRLFILSCVAASLAACSAGAPPFAEAPVPAAGSVQQARHGRATLTLRILIPKKHRHRHRRGARFVSPSTAGLTIAIVGPVSLNQTLAVTPTANGCTATFSGTLCTLDLTGLQPCPSGSTCYTASIDTYDAVSCSGSPQTCTIPGNAQELSANQNFAFKVVTGQQNLIGLTLDGLPASVAFVPSPTSTLSGNPVSGYALSKCASAQTVSVLGVDADGNFIVGPGSPVSTLKSSAPAYLAVAAGNPAPKFVLSVQNIPNANSSVTLTATVTPAAASGGVAQSEQIPVTFNGDICGVFTEYPTPTAASLPFSITAGSDGALWFVEDAGNRIGRIPTNATAGSSAQISEFPIGSSVGLINITAGPDGALWFTEANANAIGRIPTNATPGSGLQISTFPVPTSASRPWGIAAGSDGALWFTESAGNQIGRIPVFATPGSSAQISEFPIPTSASDPFGITAGSDGAAWFMECIAQVGRIPTFATPGSGSSITQYPVTVSSGSANVAAGSDGALWFTEQSGNRIGRIPVDAKPGTSSLVTEFPVPTSTSGPFTITAGPDGAIWFTEYLGNKIARIPTSAIPFQPGQIQEYTVPTASGGPYGIVTGPDGAIWFTERGSAKIGRLQ